MDADYCEALKTGKKEIQRITSEPRNAETLKDFVNAVQKVQSKAPERIRSEWTEYLDLVKKAAAGDQEAITTGRAKLKSLGDRITQDGLKSCGVGLD